MSSIIFEKFFFSYLISHVLLLPLFLFYLYSLIDASRVKRALFLHKSIAIGLVTLPFLLSAYSMVDNQLTGNSDTISKPFSKNEQTAPQPSSPLSSSLPTQVRNISSLGLAEIQISSSTFYMSGLFPLAALFFSVSIIIGLLFFCLRAVSNYLLLKRIKSQAYEMSHKDGFTTVRSPLINSAFSIGLFTPIIFLPSDIDDYTQHVIVQHEINHFQSRHHWWLLVDCLISHLYWLNPLSHFLKHQGEKLREIECDNETIQEIDKYVYSRILVDMAGSFSTKKSLLLSLRWSSSSALKERIENLLGRVGDKRRKIIKLSLIASLAIIVCSYFTFTQIYNAFMEDLVVDKIQRRYADYSQEHVLVEFEKLPKHVITALLLSEDRNFFGHSGFEFKAFVGASARFISNHIFGSEYNTIGGSTISMQLGKRLLLSGERHNVKYKLRQIKTAKILESHYSKEEILEMYLSLCFFGNSAWGLAEASELYFEKPYTELTVEESAMLVPVVQLPRFYNPIANPDVATQRQQALLEKMGI